MVNQLEQGCKTCSTESSSGLIEFDNNWQRIFVTALTFLFDLALKACDKEIYATLLSNKFLMFMLSFDSQ